mgnify:CR=1 FL=1
MYAAPALMFTGACGFVGPKRTPAKVKPRTNKKGQPDFKKKYRGHR